MNKDYEPRLVEEHTEISCKLAKLKGFLRTDAFEELPETEQNWLIIQCAAMKRYYEALSNRLFDGPHHLKDFSDALALLKEGRILTRSSWDKDLVVFRQVPAHINEQVVPKMQSLPEKAKQLILNNSAHISYSAQCLIYNIKTSEANSWSPSVEDIFATDWQVVSPNKNI